MEKPVQLLGMFQVSAAFFKSLKKSASVKRCLLLRLSICLKQCIVVIILLGSPQMLLGALTKKKKKFLKNWHFSRCKKKKKKGFELLHGNIQNNGKG